METTPDSQVLRVQGEVIVLHCWACGTAHCLNLELCVPGELCHMVCSNSNCRMSMFLVNELIVDDKARYRMSESERNARPAYSRFWK
jgi:hypothetical protein